MSSPTSIDNKKILAIRHGESEWNVLRRQHPEEHQRYRHPLMYAPDCSVTAEGVEQSLAAGRALEQTLESLQKETTTSSGSEQEDEKNQASPLPSFTLVVSPLRRALQTARYVRQTCRYQPSRVVVSKECAEIMLDSCDIGSNPDGLQAEFPEFDFGTLGDHWWPHGNSRETTWDKMRRQHIDGRESDEMATVRMIRLKQILQTMDDGVVVVVCHSDVIWWLTTDLRRDEAFGIDAENGEIVDITAFVLNDGVELRN